MREQGTHRDDDRYKHNNDIKYFDIYSATSSQKKAFTIVQYNNRAQKLLNHNTS